MALYEKHKQDSARIINAIKIAIPNIFRKIGCEPIKDSMYGEGVVTENNILEFLSLIEKRADEILTMYDGNQDPIVIKEKRKTDKHHRDMVEKYMAKIPLNSEKEEPPRVQSSQSIPLALAQSREEEKKDVTRPIDRQSGVKMALELLKAQTQR